MPSSAVTPQYLIELKERGSPVSLISGTNGADSDLYWHIRDSVADIVSNPIRYVTNYFRRENLQDLLRSDHKLVVSQRFRESVEPWLKDFEFLPVELELSNHRALDRVGGGEIVRDYWWLNSWRRLDLIDDALSVVAPLPPWPPSDRFAGSPVRYNGWRKLVFARPLPPDEHFFGLAHFPGGSRFVSPELHKHMIDLGLRVSFYAQSTESGRRIPFEERQKLNPLSSVEYPQA